MNPINDRQGGGAEGNRGYTPVPNPQSSIPSPQSSVQQTATANVLRSQIDALYGDNPVARQQPTQQLSYRQTPQRPVQQQPAPLQAPTQQQTHLNIAQAHQSSESPYDRTHTPNPKPQAEQWKQYHSAWQNYYQKYYEGYYNQQRAAASATQSTTQPIHTDDTAPLGENELTKDQAVRELRQKLIGQVRSRAKKIRKSRHFTPIIAALSVVFVFAFLQYNQVLFAAVNAYVSPGAIDPQNIVINPAGDGVVGDESRLIIPKINVDVPVIYGIGPDHESQMAAMQNGIAHFSIPGASSRPGEIGNTVLSGHSSNDLFEPGDYKFIFAQLDKLQEGDAIYANYNGKRYTYIVTGSEVVKPTEVSKLVYPTEKPVMTLITCTPLGTSLNRLLITAEQVSPDPATAASAPVGSGEVDQDNATMPGASGPTLIERLFGAR